MSLSVSFETYLRRCWCVQRDVLTTSPRRLIARWAVCKLPKLELPKFSGNPLDWPDFWDQFQTSIHSSSGLSDTDCLNYLKKYLCISTAVSVSGLTLSSQNYKKAISILQKRFGNPQVLISAYMDSLLKLKKVENSDDVVNLRQLYNDVENCVRNLKCLDVETSTYGCLFIPILKARLPDDLILLISRKFEENVWTLDRLLKFVSDELIAKEICGSIFNSKTKFRSNDTSKRGQSLRIVY